MTIMADGIPARFLIDSGVFMRALEPNMPKWSHKPETGQCRQLWEAATREPRRHTVLISALTLLEFRIAPHQPRAPSLRAVEYVAFDDIVADDMARWCKPDIIEDVRKETGTSRRVVAYDALIVASARVHRAECVVSLDEDIHRLAKHANVPSCPPDAIVKQLHITFDWRFNKADPPKFDD